MKAFGLTDTGKKREKNEDSIFLNTGLKLYIVADGMGGHAKGEVASRTAVNVINELLEKNFSDQGETSSGQDDSIAGLLRNAVFAANREIYGYSQKQPGKDIMGTTVSLALVRNGKMYVAHVGDSRIYRLRGDSLEKLTVDHNKVQELVDLGMLTEDEAEKHHLSHVLTRALGSSNAVEPDIHIFDLNPGDSFLLSSDGIFRVLKSDRVSEVMMNTLSPEEKCRILVEETLEGGAPDNVSVIILETEKKDL